MIANVKICGLTRYADVETAIMHGASYLGFIVEAKSARRLTVNQAAKLSRIAEGTVPIVAVTVNPDDALLERIADEMRPDFIQLHGDETPARAAQIYERYNLGVIKALPISSPKDLAAIHAYDVDHILLDAKPPKGAARGGHGKSFNWIILKDSPLPNGWILAGGLNLQNVRLAVRQTKAPIIDISSGVEALPGIKDPEKIETFMGVLDY